MEKIVCSRKNRFRLTLFVFFSVIFILSGIPGVYKEFLLYGSGYFTSRDFFYTALSFVPFILCTIYFYLVVRRKYVIVIDENGILDQRYLLGKIFFSWEDIQSVAIDKKDRENYLIIKTCADFKKSDIRSPDTITHQIPLKGINCDVDGINLFFTSRFKKN